MALPKAASAQTACTARSQTALLNSFADNVPPASISPRTMRDFVCSTITPDNSGAFNIGTAPGVTGVNIGNAGSTTTVAGAANFRLFSSSIQYYVNGTTGNDSNNCTAVGTACKTIRGAINKVNSVDLQGANTTINIAAGTYDESLMVTGGNPGASSNIRTNGAAIILYGAGSATTAVSPNVNCSPGKGDALTVSGGAVVLVGNLTLTTGCSGRSDLFIQNYGYVGLFNSDVVFGNAGIGANGQHIHVESFGMFEVASSLGYTIAGNATAHWSTSLGHIEIDVGASVICTGAPAFSVAFAYAEKAALIDTGGTAFTGCAGVTGKKYQVQSNATIHLGSALVLPPGNADGVFTTGGLIRNTSGSILNQGPVAPPVTTVAVGHQDGATTVTGTITKSSTATWLDLDLFGIGGASGDGFACGVGGSCSAGAAGAGGGHTRIHVRWADITGAPTSCSYSIPPSHVHGTAGPGTATVVICGTTEYRAGGGGDGANGANGAKAGGGGGGGVASGGAGTTSGGLPGGGGTAGGDGSGAVAVATWSGSGGGGDSNAALAGQNGGASNNGPSGGGAGAGCVAGAAGTPGNGGANQAADAATGGAAGTSDDSGGSGGSGGAAATGAGNAGNGGAAGNPGGGAAGGGDTCNGGTGTVGQGAAGGYGAVYAVQS